MNQEAGNNRTKKRGTIKSAENKERMRKHNLVFRKKKNRAYEQMINKRLGL